MPLANHPASTLNEILPSFTHHRVRGVITVFTVEKCHQVCRANMTWKDWNISLYKSIYRKHVTHKENKNWENPTSLYHRKPVFTNLGIWEDHIPRALQTGKRQQVYNDHDQICQTKISPWGVWVHVLENMWQQEGHGSLKPHTVYVRRGMWRAQMTEPLLSDRWSTAPESGDHSTICLICGVECIKPEHRGNTLKEGPNIWTLTVGHQKVLRFLSNYQCIAINSLPIRNKLD